MGYFKSVQFIFLVVGHTKNAADRLFNSLKHEYLNQNLFMFDELVRALDQLAQYLSIEPLPMTFLTTTSSLMACIGS
jgi:hypothetical protein